MTCVPLFTAISILIGFGFTPLMPDEKFPQVIYQHDQMRLVIVNVGGCAIRIQQLLPQPVQL